jgi:hypothetical protein
MPPESQRKPCLQVNICQPLFQQEFLPDKVATGPNLDPKRPYVPDYIEFFGQGSAVPAGMACQLRVYLRECETRMFRRADYDECGSDETRDS